MSKLPKSQVIPNYPRLREWRLHLKLTQEDVAESMGVSPAAVSRWEKYPYAPHDKNNRVMDLPTLALYAAALGWPAPALYSAPRDVRLDPLIAHRSDTLKRQAAKVVQSLIADDEEHTPGKP